MPGNLQSSILNNHHRIAQHLSHGKWDLNLDMISSIKINTNFLRTFLYVRIKRDPFHPKRAKETPDHKACKLSQSSEIKKSNGDLSLTINKEVPGLLQVRDLNYFFGFLKNFEPSLEDELIDKIRSFEGIETKEQIQNDIKELTENITCQAQWNKAIEKATTYESLGYETMVYLAELMFQGGQQHKDEVSCVKVNPGEVNLNEVNLNKEKLKNAANKFRRVLEIPASNERVTAIQAKATLELYHLEMESDSEFINDREKLSQLAQSMDAVSKLKPEKPAININKLSTYAELPSTPVKKSPHWKALSTPTSPCLNINDAQGLDTDNDSDTSVDIWMKRLSLRFQMSAQGNRGWFDDEIQTSKKRKEDDSAKQENTVNSSSQVTSENNPQSLNTDGRGSIPTMLTDMRIKGIFFHFRKGTQCAANKSIGTKRKLFVDESPTKKLKISTPIRKGAQRDANKSIDAKRKLFVDESPTKPLKRSTPTPDTFFAADSKSEHSDSQAETTSYSSALPQKQN